MVAPGAKLQKLAGEFEFAEGATCDARGNVFFTDQPNNRIMEWSVEGKLTTFLQPAGRANGMYFDAAGNLLACADEKTELWLITPDGKHTVLAQEFDGRPLNGPNDVWVVPAGGYYITDPFYKREWWTYNQRPQDTEQVYFVPPGHKPLKRVTSDLVKPNGIVGTPDGKTLFVADIGADRTYVYDIQPDGSLAGKRLVCKKGSDGMTLDTDGNLYPDRPRRFCVRQGRTADRPHRGAGTVGGKSLFRRPGQTHAVPCSLQRPLFDPPDDERSQPGEIAARVGRPCGFAAGRRKFRLEPEAEAALHSLPDARPDCQSHDVA